MENTLKRLWDDLSLEEKSDVMASAVRHGITTLPEIKDKWNEFAEGGPLGDTVEDYANAIYQDSSEEPYGVPLPHYNNVSDAALALLAPDARGHYDDVVKLPNHPSSPERGTFNGQDFNLTDYGMEDPNYSLFGLLDNGDGDATLRYNDAYVIPELTVTPNGNYYDNTYDNIRIRKYYTGGAVNHDSKYEHATQIYQSYINQGINPQTALELTNQKIAEKGWTGWVSGDNKRYNNINDFTSHTVDQYNRLYPDSLKSDNFNQFFQGIEGGRIKYNPTPSKYRQDLLRTRPGVKKRINEYRRLQGQSPLTLVSPDSNGMPWENSTLFNSQLPLEQPAIAANGGNLFKGGGNLYVPSEKIKKEIANWEGASMKTNRSFEEEARDFNRVIPENIRRSLTQQQLDALYSYGYNVGMGNLRERTLPVLTNYANGKAGAKDVTKAMWASLDPKLKGLENRRNWEKSVFMMGTPAGRQNSVVDDALNMDLSYLGQQQPLFEGNPTEYSTPEWMKAPEITLDDNNPTMPEPKAPKEEPKNNGLGLLHLMNALDSSDDNPFTGYDNLVGQRQQTTQVPFFDNNTLLDNSWFSNGGYLHGHRFDDGGVRYLSTDQFSINPLTGNIITDDNDKGVVVLPEVTVMPKRITDISQVNNDMMTAANDATTVSRQPYYPFPTPELSPDATLKRANKVYSNYSDAVDNPMSSVKESVFNLLRSAKDNIWEGIPSRVSNCTLTATQWIDPNNPVKSAKSIVGNPAKYHYKKIPKNDVSVGNLVIAKEPKKDVFHTMIISGFANKDGNYNFNGKSYNVRKGEPLVTYSSGGHDNSFLRKNIPLSVYTANSDGKTENLFYKYSLNNSHLQR